MQPTTRGWLRWALSSRSCLGRVSGCECRACVCVWVCVVSVGVYMCFATMCTKQNCNADVFLQPDCQTLDQFLNYLTGIKLVGPL